jgi:hypothetical protein
MMDGILSAINSLIPLVPENSLITDRGNVKNPPVEVAPVPDDSFKSDDVLAKTLKRAYTLDLDIRGYEGKAAYKGQTGSASKTSVPNQPIDAEHQKESILDEAFTLSLGSGEELQLTSESMREMLRLKNYEMLGKMGGRKVAVKNPEQPAVDQKEPQGSETAAPKGSLDPKWSGITVTRHVAQQEAELLAHVLSQTEETQQPVYSGPEREGNKPTAPLTDGTDELLQNMQRGLQAEEGLRPHSSTSYAIKDQAGAQPQVLTNPGHTQESIVNDPLLTGKSAGNLNADNSAEAALPAPNGLQTEELVTTQNAETESTFNLLLFDKNARNNIESPFNLLFSTADRARNPQIPSGGERLEEQLGNLRTAALIDPELSRITGDILTAARPSDLVQSIAGGSMVNLKKIKELPYALYIFGQVTEKTRGSVLDEENDAVIQEETERKPDQPQAGLLRISEAIKMAAVLHHIYYGGDGRFENENPWYWPYVSYALKHGIIQVDDFSDFNSFATKAETAYIFSRCVPDAEFAILNYIPFVPDVTEDSDWGERIYLLFRAGVLMGTDNSGRFYPDRLMTRAEAAAIIGRIATPADRKGFVI